MNHTQEQLAALSDIELNLIIARDVAGHPDAFNVDGGATIWILVDGAAKPLPDYLNDLNAIDDLCREKGFKWANGYNFVGEYEYFQAWRIGGVDNYVVKHRLGFNARCRFLCEALVLAWQESKKK